MGAQNQKQSCTDELDRQLLRRVQAGDDLAFEELLKIHTWLIEHWLRLALDEAPPGANQEDLRQEAHLGVFQAALKYDFSIRANFHAYARMRAWGQMMDSREVRRVGRTSYENHVEMREAQERLMKKLDRQPTLEELAEEANLTTKQVENALSLLVFAEPLDENQGTSETDKPDLEELLGDEISQLTPEQTEVVIRRYQGQSHREIAEALGMSEVRVRKIYQRAKEKLRDIIRDKGSQEDGI